MMEAPYFYGPNLAMDELLSELAEYNDMKDMLAHLRKFFADRADAEFFPDSPSPVINQEMRILGMIDEALKEF